MRNHAIIILDLNNNPRFVIEGFKEKDVELDLITDKIQEHYEGMYDNVKVEFLNGKRFANIVVNYDYSGKTEQRILMWSWFPSFKQK